jgi:hypothetical protein
VTGTRPTSSRSCGEGDWFTAQLLRLISKADRQSRESLRKGFPEEVEAYEKWFYKDSYETYKVMQ